MRVTGLSLGLDRVAADLRMRDKRGSVTGTLAGSPFEIVTLMSRTLEGRKVDRVADRVDRAWCRFPIAAPGDALSNAITSAESAWLDAINKLGGSMNHVFENPPTHLTSSALTALADHLHGCATELARIGPPTDRLRPVHALAAQACARYDPRSAVLRGRGRGWYRPRRGHQQGQPDHPASGLIDRSPRLPVTTRRSKPSSKPCTRSHQRGGSVKIGQTALVGQYRDPSISWGSSTGLGDFPTLVWDIGNGYHITIYPDEEWKFAQMAWQSEDPERVHQLHTEIDDISFDQWHLTYPNYGSVFVDLNGNIMAGSDGNQDMRDYALAIQPNLF